jgi:predicted site-specific integrase-resolvase
MVHHFQIQYLVHEESAKQKQVMWCIHSSLNTNSNVYLIRNVYSTLRFTNIVIRAENELTKVSSQVNPAVCFITTCTLVHDNVLIWLIWWLPAHLVG